MMFFLNDRNPFRKKNLRPKDAVGGWRTLVFLNILIFLVHAEPGFPGNKRFFNLLSQKEL